MQQSLCCRGPWSFVPGLGQEFSEDERQCRHTTNFIIHNGASDFNMSCSQRHSLVVSFAFQPLLPVNRLLHPLKCLERFQLALFRDVARRLKDIFALNAAIALSSSSSISAHNLCNDPHHTIGCFRRSRVYDVIEFGMWKGTFTLWVHSREFNRQTS